MMRERAFRRHQAFRHGMRRLKEDRNQHYDDFSCPCWYDSKHIARMRDTPKPCSCYMCGNQRRWYGPTMQERKYAVNIDELPAPVTEAWKRTLNEFHSWLDQRFSLQ